MLLILLLIASSRLGFYLQLLVFKFPLLETLCFTLTNSTRFSIQHSHLKTLHLYEEFDDPFEVEIDAPKLCHFYCHEMQFLCRELLGRQRNPTCCRDNPLPE